MRCYVESETMGILKYHPNVNLKDWRYGYIRRRRTKACNCKGFHPAGSVKEYLCLTEGRLFSVEHMMSL